MVPNVAIAKSFNHGGVKSMKVAPRANNGVALAVKNAPTNSATARTTAADTTPANAAIPLASRILRLFLVMYRDSEQSGARIGVQPSQ
ncbi:hypothetical protein NicSoilE8_06110 [Arthrobacter sp. NicSoilE8]|nr:hypothetical protein NicSoilE8_06110 [Arthrobacter sp. NicSoilE8]